MAQLQLTFDHGKRHEIIRSTNELADHVDIVEIGYPELITFGLDLVSELHEMHPQLKLCVDAKVFHGGSGVTRRCFEAGASIVTVLAYAPDEVIKQMVFHAHEYGGAVMCNLDGVRNLGKRTAEVDRLGVSYCHVSTGFLMEHEYDLMKPQKRSIFQMRPLERAAAVKRNLIHAKLALGTGINEDNLDEVLKYHPEIVMIGRGIFAADGAYKTTLERRIEVADRIRARLHAAQ
ncbi:MAG: orotidine 5'-phosphate decarboxylase / HUMPS family protein [Atopobiaceae bacterium]|jgi:3-hexulose-6-phosphate synthase|nr:orotidine 5'-phosphate decarboxylase / HUMPS family protein [Atopobiaceae bacterium]